MENKVKIFNSEIFGQIRVISINDKPWFIAKDVSDILGYRDAYTMTRRLDDDEKDTHNVCTLGGNQEMNVISESGLYTAILGSNKQEAKEFKRWITHKVLPTIRKTGGYVQEDREAEFIDTYFPSFSDEVKKSMVLDLHTKNKQLKKENETIKPLADKYSAYLDTDGYMSMGNVAKMLQSKVNNIGRNRLIEFLQSTNVLLKDRTPAQRYMEDNMLFKVADKVSENGKTNRCTVCSPRGFDMIESLVNDKYKQWINNE